MTDRASVLSGACVEPSTRPSDPGASPAAVTFRRVFFWEVRTPEREAPGLSRETHRMA